MSNSKTAKEVLALIKALAAKLGRTPRRADLEAKTDCKEWDIRKNFGTFNRAIVAAGLKIEDTCLKPEEVLEAIRLAASKLKHPPTKAEFFANSTCTEWDVRKNFGSFDKAIREAGLAKTELELKILSLQNTNRVLNEQVDELQDRALASDSLRALIGSMSTHSYGAEHPDWMQCKASKSSTLGIPLLFLSDIHFDEIVKPEQIGFVNEYNNSIAVKRINYTFQHTVQLLKHYVSSPKYDGIVCALGGDMLSGNIHEELKETNEKSINRSLIELTDLLINGISLLAEEFGKVFVPCVVGNHGRHDKKPRMKNQVYDNYEWLVYQFVARHFINDSRVTFFIPDGPDAQFSIYNKKFMLTHGNQFHGGTGIAGIFSPLMLGMARKQRRQNAVQKPFDVLMMGHWHQYLTAQRLLVNGSVKGYDEYAYNSNFGFEKPQQALFIVRPDSEITFSMPVFCDGWKLTDKLYTMKDPIRIG